MELFEQILAAAPDPTERERWEWLADYDSKNNPPPTEKDPAVREALRAANIATTLCKYGHIAGFTIDPRVMHLTNTRRLYNDKKRIAWAAYVRDIYKPRWALRVYEMRQPTERN